MENRALSANEEQSPRSVSLANAPKFILVGYALNNKILVRSVPGFNESRHLVAIRVMSKTCLLPTQQLCQLSAGTNHQYVSNSMVVQFK